MTICQKSIGTTKGLTVLIQKVRVVLKNIALYTCKDILIDFQLKQTKLRFVTIGFDTSTFDKVTKDRAAKFVDMLSAIGGTMGLLTGFSIISGVEILYFVVKIFINYLKRLHTNVK